MDTNILEKNGLKKNEVKIYLACLGSGELTVTSISRETTIPRATVYFVIDEMIKKGLVSKVTRGAHTYISPASPEKIKEIAISNEQEAKIQREQVEKMMPDLTRYANSMPNRPKIQYFTGREGLRAIFEDLLTSGEIKNYYIGSIQNIVNIAGERFVKDWVKRRTSAGIFSYAVRKRSDETLPKTFKSNRKMLREVRFAPKGFSTSIYLIIYGNKVAFITSKKEGFGMIIESADFAETQKALFDILWETSTKYSE